MNNNRPLSPEEKKQLQFQGKSFCECLEILNEKMNISASTSAPTRYAYWLIRCLIDQWYRYQSFDSEMVRELYSELVSGQFRREISPSVAGSRAADKAINILEAMAVRNLYLPFYR